jgi:hypothetical protein
VLTENAVGECEVGDAMLGQLEADAPLEQADADGAYATRRTYRALRERGARVCLPPRENACPWKEQEGFEKQRNAAIEAIGAHGKARWKREVGYHRRSLAERCFGSRPCSASASWHVSSTAKRLKRAFVCLHSIPLPYWACQRVSASVKHKRPCR